MVEEKTWDFDEYADDYDGWVDSDDPVYARYEYVLDRVVDLSGAAPGRKILDIGTGTGNLAERLLALGANVTGLDPSRKMLGRAAAKPGCQGVDLVCVREPFLDLPYSDATFDAVVSTYAFHHVHPAKKARCVREMVRVLRSGGSWVLGDLVFRNEAAEQTALELYDWMEEEYYARIDELVPVFEILRMKLRSEQVTPVTWILWAVKPLDSDPPTTSDPGVLQDPAPEG
jgi:putative AdoMet-dependent methyltransferase